MRECKVQKIKKIGCLGMSANPPHLGHLKIAKEILRKKIIDEVWLIPCLFHPFEKKLIDWKHRWNMVNLMSGGKIRACDIEFKKGGVSYTIDTVLALKNKFPRHRFFWIVGSDTIKNKEYKKWKDWQDLLKEIEFLAVPRENFDIKKSDLPFNFQLVNIKPIKNISSTLIREKIKKGESLRGLVVTEIEDYIARNQLYR